MFPVIAALVKATRSISLIRMKISAASVMVVAWLNPVRTFSQASLRPGVIGSVSTALQLRTSTRFQYRPEEMYAHN